MNAYDIFKRNGDSARNIGVILATSGDAAVRKLLGRNDLVQVRKDTVTGAAIIRQSPCDYLVYEIEWPAPENEEERKSHVALHYYDRSRLLNV